MFTNELSAQQSELLSFFFFPEENTALPRRGPLRPLRLRMGRLQPFFAPGTRPGRDRTQHRPTAHRYALGPTGNPAAPAPPAPSSDPRTAALPAAPASRAQPVPLSGTAQHALPVPVPVPTPAPQGVSDGTAPSWGRPGRGGAVPDRAEPSPAGGSAPSPAPAPPWQRGYVGARAVPHESFLF